MKHILSATEIRQVCPQYTIDNRFLRIDGKRYWCTNITNVSFTTKYYFGLDNTPGITYFNLVINQDVIEIHGLVAHDELKHEYPSIVEVLNAYIEEIKTAIHF